MSVSTRSTGTYSLGICTHLNPTLFSEKLPKQPNLTIHQVISIFQLPPVVADHITSLFSKYKFTPQHLPYLTSIDLNTILTPPFPTPPLQCQCQPMTILNEGFKTIAFNPTFPTSAPSTNRQHIISCLESYEKASLFPVSTPNDILSRIIVQMNVRNVLLSLLPQQLDVNVTIPQHKNLPSSYDIDRVVDDLQHCYTIWLQEEEEKNQKKEIGEVLADLGIQVPPITTHTSTPTPTTQSTPIGTGIASGIAGAPLPNKTTSLPRGPVSQNPDGSSAGRSIAPSSSSSLRPSKYHTLNLRKETNVSITKLDSFGNHTPIYGDGENEGQFLNENLASPKSGSSYSNSIFSSSSPSTQLSSISTPGGGQNGQNNTQNGQNQHKHPTLSRIGSSQPQFSSVSTASRSSTTTPTSSSNHNHDGGHHFENFSNKNFQNLSASTNNHHPHHNQQQNQFIGPNGTNSIQLPKDPSSNDRAASLFARAQQSLANANALVGGTVGDRGSTSISHRDSSTTVSKDHQQSPPSPQQSYLPSPQAQPPQINISATPSVESFSLFTPRGRSGTNTGLSQLADRFAVANTGTWVPYWKKTSAQIEELLISWDFALFQDIQEQHRSEILLRLSVWMFVNCGVVNALNLPLDKLTRFLHHISTLYRDNPYHNHLHAWTTLHYTYLLIKQTSFNKRIEYSPTVILSMLLASICHDVDHPGNNNHFEVQTMSKLAMLHNDNSVLENHHCFVTFSLLSRPEFSILSSLNKLQLKEVRGLIVSIILNTDMALHNDLTDSFGKASEELLTASTDSSQDSNTLSVKTQAAFGLIARVLVHCSDIAGQALPLKSAFLWALRLRDEFLEQADTEAKLGLPVTPFMTGLDDITFAKSQLGFIRGVLRPLWVRMSITFPATKPSLQHISDNEAFWQTFIEEYEKNDSSNENRLRNFSITSTLTSPNLRGSISNTLAGPLRSTGNTNTTPAVNSIASRANSLSGGGGLNKNTGGSSGNSGAAGHKNRKYTLDEHYIRSLQAKDLPQVPESNGESDQEEEDQEVV